MRNRFLNIAIIMFIALIFLLFYLLKNEIVQGMFISVGLLVCLIGISSCIVIMANNWSRDRKHRTTVHKRSEDSQHTL